MKGCGPVCSTSNWTELQHSEWGNGQRADFSPGCLQHDIRELKGWTYSVPKTRSCTTPPSLGWVIFVFEGPELQTKPLCSTLKTAGKQLLIHVLAAKARLQGHWKQIKTPPYTYLSVTALLKLQLWKDVHAISKQNTVIGLVCHCLNKEWQYITSKALRNLWFWHWIERREGDLVLKQ